VFTFELPEGSPVGSEVDIVIGRGTLPSPRFGVFVSATAANTSALPCRCRHPVALAHVANLTEGVTCAFHRIDNLRPWCFVGEACPRRKVFSSSHSTFGGLYYDDMCRPGQVRVEGGAVSRRYKTARLLSFVLAWNSTYMVVMEEQGDSVLSGTGTFSVGVSQVHGSHVQAVQANAAIMGRIA
jgi:hypothetical protein